MTRGGKKVRLGNFATFEEAALCVAREGQAARRCKVGRRGAPTLQGGAAIAAAMVAALASAKKAEAWAQRVHND